MRPLRVLVGCETSGIVRNAFLKLGHDAWSCDLLAAEDQSNRHMICDVRDQLAGRWDLLAVMHPPCTRLCNSGVRWLTSPPKRLGAEHYSAAEIEAYAGMAVPDRLDFMWDKLREGAALFSDCWNAPIEKICIENPVMHRHAKALIRNFQKAAQTVQPHWFGEPAFKATGFYLKGLSPLEATLRLTTPKPGTAEHKRWSRVHRASPGPNRWRERSRFFHGIADAMAMQWGGRVGAEEMAA